MRCGCPCNQQFDPSHDRQIYIDARHRQAAYRDRVKKTARANGVPDHLNLQTAQGTRKRHGDAQTRRKPDLRVSYRRAIDSITALLGGDATLAHDALDPLLTARQRTSLEAAR